MKKCIAMLAALSMICSFMAADISEPQKNSEQILYANAEYDEDYYEEADPDPVWDNFYYIEKKDGTVEITGVVELVSSINIPSEINGKTVTSIGSAALGDGNFGSDDTIKEVVIPDTVTEIKSFAFDGCTGIEKITIPDSVVKIGYSAFQNCTSLKEIHIGKNVKEIGDNAFYNASSLEKINIPDSLKFIGNDVFTQTSWLEARRAENPIVTIGNTLIDASTAEGDLILPEGIEVIKDSSFNVPMVLVSHDLSGDGVYAGYTSWESVPLKITSISIPSTVKMIEGNPFAIMASQKDDDGNRILRSISVSSSNQYYTAKDNMLMTKGGSELLACVGYLPADLVIPDTVKVIPDGFFSWHDEIESVTIPDSVVFVGTTNEYGEGSYNYESSGAFGYCQNLKSVYMSDNVKRLGANIFNNCPSLTDVRLSENLCEIPYFAFDQCESLENITIPDSVTEISYYSFSGTAALKNQKGNVKYIDNWVIEYSGENVEIKDGTVGIASAAYQISSYDEDDNYIDLTTLTLPDTLKHVPYYLNAKNLTTVNASDEVKKLCSLYLYETPWGKENVEAEHLDNGLVIVDNVVVDGQSCSGDVVIPEGVTRIKSGAFFDWTNYDWENPDDGSNAIRSIKLPNSIKVLDNNIFFGLKYCEKIEFPENLEYLGLIFGDKYAAVAGSSVDIDELALPETLTYVDPYTFDTMKIGTLIYPSSITTLEEGISQGGWLTPNFKSVNTIIYPEGLEMIPDCVANQCELKKVYIPASVTYIGGIAFAGNEVEDIYFGGTEEQWYDIARGAGSGGPYHNSGFYDAEVHFNASPEDAMKDDISSVYHELGDVDGNGMIDSSDASLVLVEYSLLQTGKESSLTPEQKKSADTNKDGSIDSSDASKILTYYADISTGKTPSWD